ncbi:hypothetical protein HMPREF0476_0292 [Kingella kingae ATCC 23330]|uniref:Uncharacterized protein n=1 Tax=Kingella kingae ATCC 23330 TaxID=887327 RepID=F5S509_KINKI|nr:hypothetical protein HMPREF0476_0292 [Kingella kingae ATCC 23330]
MDFFQFLTITIIKNIKKQPALSINKSAGCFFRLYQWSDASAAPMLVIERTY